LLGLLSENSGHGYGLRKQMVHRLGHFRNINEGQLYTQLAKMENEGLIEREVVVPDKGPARKLLHITPKGKEAFQDWLRSDQHENEGILYDFMQGYSFFAKVNFFQHLDPEETRRKIRFQISLMEEKRKSYRDILSQMEQRDADPFRTRILAFGLKEMEHRIEWLNELEGDLISPPKEAAQV
jgi:DNA-binding PadR family transcriptional regulator